MRAPKTDRVQLMMSPAEIAAIDDWMFANRVRSRAEAIRQLVSAGMDRLTTMRLAMKVGPGLVAQEEAAELATWLELASQSPMTNGLNHIEARHLARAAEFLREFAAR